jgi:hypothetical protein
MIQDEWVPDEAAISAWIDAIFARGVRRPGSDADRWTEAFLAERARELGLERVREEPVQVAGWEPRAWSLRIRDGERERALECFPVPFSAPCDELELPLVAWDPANPGAVAGAAALYDVRLLRIPPGFVVGDEAARIHDPGRTLAGATQVLPFGPEIMHVMEPAIAAGARAFVGALAGYPGDSCRYYVPYDGVARPIPGAWIRGSDGARLREELASGPLCVRLRADVSREPLVSHNVIGELPGADDEIVVVGSHHDGPWASAVEDASGTALVLAQAAYWSRVPREERPHRMLFLWNAAHMSGGAGCRAFLDAHAAQLERIVLELHLEHAAREFAESAGRLAPTGRCEPRWFFTSEIPLLRAAVRDALEAEGLSRSLILRPDALAPIPTTDAGFFHERGVPLVNFLAAPFYLFDAMDDLGKVDRASLVPLTRWAIRMIEATHGRSARAMRAGSARSAAGTPSSRA